MTYQEVQPSVFTISNFFSPEECEYWINFSEDQGYEEAGITTGYNRQRMMKSVRNNERFIYDNVDLAKQLWERLEPFVPTEYGIGRAVGLNERFRFYKYLPTHRFKPHQDGSFIRNIHEWSSFTFMVYLNEEMKGGATKFIRSQVSPETGKAVVFQHRLVHEGAVVEEGVKYVLRSDIMYRRKGH